MHNFRGFTKTLVPLRATNFLVGENSTGKTSFLQLLYALNRPEFSFSSEIVSIAGPNAFSFGDLHSAWPSDSKTFRVGFVDIKEEKKSYILRFNIYEYADVNDTPKLVRYFRLAVGEGLTIVNLNGPRLRYIRNKASQTFV